MNSGVLEHGSVFTCSKPVFFLITGRMLKVHSKILELRSCQISMFAYPGTFDGNAYLKT